MNSEESQLPESEKDAPQSSDNLEALLIEPKLEELGAKGEIEESNSQQDSQATETVNSENSEVDVDELSQVVAELQQQKQSLEKEVSNLQEQRNQLLAEQTAEVKANLEQIVKDGLRELQKRQQALEVSVEQLERRRDRIREEMRTTFAGVSQDLAVRVQGFKDYLVGSLQDLAVAAEQLELSGYDEWETSPKPEVTRAKDSQIETQFTEQTFQERVRQIREILDQYRTVPDYYGPPWQLRRTFEPIHAERVRGWFFTQGGRGAIKSMGSRLQNILITSAVMSVLKKLYGNRLRTLVLANTPERLGEWRRSLQDCLGISRSDFGPERGVTLFESPDALVMKAERLLDNKALPLIIIDETEEQIDLSLLQFPLWLAFAPEPQQNSSYMY
ncbi:MAG: DUF3086 domain-containing protein [Spirulinaceae cyanobacterium]